MCIRDRLSPEAGAQAPAEETFALSLDDLRAALGTDAAAAGLAQVFLSSLTDDAQRLAPLLDAMDRAELRQWTHRTGGALALLHNACVDAVAAAFRDAVHHGLSLIHSSEPTRLSLVSRMPSSA